VPTQLTIEPGEYLVNIACPGELPEEGVGAEPPPLHRTLAIPEDGNYYQPPPLPRREFPIGSSGDGIGLFPIGSSGDGIGFYPSTYFQYPVYPGSGGSAGYMPGGWRPPNYNYAAPFTRPPLPRPIKQDGIVIGIEPPQSSWWSSWTLGREPSAWDEYQLTAGSPDAIDTPEDWVYGYDRDAGNDPRTNKSLSDSLMELPFGVYSWDRTSSVTTG